MMSYPETRRRAAGCSGEAGRGTRIAGGDALSMNPVEGPLTWWQGGGIDQPGRLVRRESCDTLGPRSGGGGESFECGGRESNPHPKEWQLSGQPVPPLPLPSHTTRKLSSLSAANRAGTP